MGCFSYLCKECGAAVMGSDYDVPGENVHLYHLVEGKSVEYMMGEYDCYGRVLDNNGKAFEWKSDDWDILVTEHFNEDRTSGFAAVHSDCFRGRIPKTISEDDPGQGCALGFDDDMDNNSYDVF